MSKSRLDTWFSKYISSGANTATAATYQKIYASPYTRYQNILDNYSWYYLPTSYNARSLYYSNSQYRNINYYSNYAFGVRVLVTLSSDAKFSSTRTGTKTVTGGNTSTYGGKQTYNVWGIQQKEASLKTTNAETTATSGFLGNTSIQRQNIDNVTFVNSTSGANSTKWDVSETGDGSILAWYETQANGTYKVYIGSESGTIYANTDSSYLFANIGSGDKCTSTETITNIELLNTSKTTNMKNMFSATGNTAMTKLELGKNFDTSNVTNMESMFDSMGGAAMTNLELGSNFNTSKVTNMKAMFANTGAGVMTSLNLGDKFNTSQVTDMSYMFYGTGAGAMTTLTLGDNFDTSKVKDMSNMFFATGSTAMTSLSLGDKFSTASATTMENMFAGTGGTAMTELDLGLAFTKIASTNTEIFSYCGKTGCVIYVPKEIYQDSTHAKINSTSTTTVEYTNGTFKTIERDGTLKTTNTETERTSGFLGNTSIQRQNIDNITFLDSRSGANSTKWDVSEEGNGSILAWYETQANGTYKVYKFRNYLCK